MKTYGLGFTRCEKCSGMGFFRHGDFYDGTFKPCADCAGIGQLYSDPQPVVEAKKEFA
jgi:DnaJ-class molecular chaperone